jgi:O-antigen/teichoic acid export membrane protein
MSLLHMQQSTSLQHQALTRPTIQKVLFGLLSVAGAVLSYLLYPVLAQILSPAQFGDVSIAVALSGQITGLLLAFNVVSIYVVHTHSSEEAQLITGTIQKILVQLLLVVTVFTLTLSPWLLQLLKIESVWTLIGLAVLVLLSVPAVVWTGYLQGHGELTRIGLYNAGAALAKLACAILFCLAGWGAPGAILGIIGGQFLGLWVIRLIPGTNLPPAWSSLQRVQARERTLIRPLFAYIARSLVVVGMFSFLFPVDIVLAKVLFSQHAAGIYAGVASLGRVIFFGASILIWIMLAGVHPQRINTSRRVFLRYMTLISLASLIAIGVFASLMSSIVRLSLGAEYLVAAPVLWWVGLSQTIAVLLYAYTLYLLVMRRGRPAALSLFITMGALLAVALWHPSTTAQLLEALISGQIIGLGLYGILIAKDRLTRRTP